MMLLPFRQPENRTDANIGVAASVAPRRRPTPVRSGRADERMTTDNPSRQDILDEEHLRLLSIFQYVRVGLNCLAIPYGTFAGVMTFIVLGRDSVRSKFAPSTAPVATSGSSRGVTPSVPQG
jgi:hypothetical protein